MTNYFQMRLSDEQLQAMSVLGLAHIGDSVYELMVRAWLGSHGRTTSKSLHKETVRYVSAPAQAKASQRILDKLSDGERSAFRRGRNTKVNSVPKNAELSEYHAATGLETLFGYLFLKGETDRLNELFAFIMEE